MGLLQQRHPFRVPVSSAASLNSRYAAIAVHGSPAITISENTLHHDLTARTPCEKVRSCTERLTYSNKVSIYIITYSCQFVSDTGHTINVWFPATPHTCEVYWEVTSTAQECAHDGDRLALSQLQTGKALPSDQQWQPLFRPGQTNRFPGARREAPYAMKRKHFSHRRVVSRTRNLGAHWRQSICHLAGFL